MPEMLSEPFDGGRGSRKAANILCSQKSAPLPATGRKSHIQEKQQSLRISRPSLPRRKNSIGSGRNYAYE